MSKRLKIIGIALAVCIVAITVTVLVLRQWANRPADGTLHTGTPTAHSPTEETATEPLSIQTDYFTTRLPAGFTIKRQETTPDKPTRLQFVAANKHQQFAITIAALPAEGLPGVGSYNLRVTDTATYEPYRPAGIPTAATAFRALSGPPAFAAFWPNGNLYAEIALTSDGAATLSDLFNSFVQASHAWEWQ